MKKEDENLSIEDCFVEINLRAKGDESEIPGEFIRLRKDEFNQLITLGVSEVETYELLQSKTVDELVEIGLTTILKGLIKEGKERIKRQKSK